MNFHAGLRSFARPVPILGLSALAVLSLALAACGDSGASQEEIEAARKQGAVKAHQQERIREIQKELKSLKKNGVKPPDNTVVPATAPASEGVSTSGNCGGSLSVNEHTSCGFAENVEAEYYAEIVSGSGTVIAYSPATGQTYSMYCTAGTPHTCTGGNDAAVYFP